MYCIRCGSQIPDSSNVCPVCGAALSEQNDNGAGAPGYQNNNMNRAGGYGNGGYGNNSGYARSGGMQNMQGRFDNTGRKDGNSGIDTVFHHIDQYRRTTGSVCEFVIFIALCVIALSALVLSFMEVSQGFRHSGLVKFSYFFVFLTAAGTAVLVAFRKKELAIYIGFGTVYIFDLLFMVLSGLNFKQFINDSARLEGILDYNILHLSTKGILAVILAFILSVGVFVLLSIQFFSNIDFSNVIKWTSIAAAVFSVTAVALSFHLYKISRLTEDILGEYYYGRYSEIKKNLLRETHRILKNYNRFTYSTFGIIVFALLEAAVCVYLYLYFSEVIEQGTGRIKISTGNSSLAGNSAYGTGYGSGGMQPGYGSRNVMQGGYSSGVQVQSGYMKCIAGPLAGKTADVRNAVLFGSDSSQVTIAVNDRYISHKHCYVQYDPKQNAYVVMDISSNGTFLNGTRIPKNTYITCRPGTVISMGSNNVQWVAG